MHSCVTYGTIGQVNTRKESDTKMLTTKDVAERLNVTTRTVRNLIECGKLKAYKIMKDYRIEEKDLQEFIEKSKIDNA